MLWFPQYEDLALSVQNGNPNSSSSTALRASSADMGKKWGGVRDPIMLVIEISKCVI
jgi:hypothetical protein